MSSLVKKGGALFTPKIKKVIRKKQTPTPKPTQSPTANQPASPPPTQASPNNDKKDQDEEAPVVTSPPTSIRHLLTEDSGQLASPASTQAGEQPNFRMTLSNASPKKPAADDADVDPKDNSAPNENAIASSSEDESDDNENIFRPPVDAGKTRRQSITQRRRLSSINPPGIRSRSASILINTDPNHIPAKIGIPIGKPVKRRRSLAQNRATKRIAGIAPPKSVRPVNISISDAPKSAEADSETKEEKQRPFKKSDKKGVSDEFIVGIDPVTQKLTKFRRKGTAGVRLKKEEEGDTIVKTEDGVVKKEEGTQEGPEEVPEEPEGLITTITSIHQIPNKISDEDIELFGEVDIDLEEMTMAELCKPTIQIGKVSSNFMLAKEATHELRQKRNQRKRDRQLARSERIPLDEAVKMNEEVRRQNGEVFVSTSEADTKPANLFDDEPAPEASSSLKLTITADGKLGVSEESAIVSKPRADANNRSVENSNPFANPITSTTYSKRVHTDKWTPDELNLFYQALSMFGTDFSLISQLFPYRSRKQIKLKFNLEERKFPEIVELALKRKLPVDFQEYCKSTKNDIKSLEYYNEELRKVRIEHEQSMNAIALEREKALKEDAEANRRREIEIRTGAKPMTRAEKVKELRKNETVVGSIDDIKKQREAEAAE
ncbi:Transcription factor TFIIIB component B'' [Candida viswanathii]|uniref:Transcription factor TFIIIB component B n=1 Tax=Candida viswanathii TaxID=5486 RepID=A0A367YA94_9ASCO|nr:Transcription factor TFIIIB component B'' [Candida viswanathii]